MNSMPIIEGLTTLPALTPTISEKQDTNDVSLKDKYENFSTNLSYFLEAYKSYVENPKDLDLKLAANDALNKTLTSLNDYEDALSNSKTPELQQLNNEVIKLRNKIKDKEKTITDTRNSTNGDYIIKQESSYYYNTMIKIGLACIIYYVFFEINYRK
jgi:gas vesicle protein